MSAPLLPTRAVDRAAIDVTLVGFGGGPIGNLFSAVPAAEADEVIDAAWRAGIRTFDTAPLYGHGLSEHRLGHALLGRPREHYVLTTKVGRKLVPSPRGTFDSGLWVDVPPLRAEYDYSYDGVRRQVEDSLQRMCQDRFDILLVHDIDRYTHGPAQPQRFREAIEGAFPALVQLRAEGPVRAIGVGVNEADVCAEVIRQVDVNVVLLAGRYTLLEQQPARELFPLCLDRQVAVFLGGVLNSGILATGAIPGAMFNYAPAPPAILDRVARLQEWCRDHDVELPTAALHFALAHPAVKQAVLGLRSVAQLDQITSGLRQDVPDGFWSDGRERGLIAPDAVTPDRPR